MPTHDHILSLVLKKLPVKSLLRFRCVSKKWRTIIDDPYFVEEHIKSSHDRQGGACFILHKRRGIFSEFYLVDPENERSNLVHVLSQPATVSVIKQSVRGLISLENQLWNPNTRKFIDLPPRRNLVMKEHYIRLENFLGFDYSINKFKILCMGKMKNCHRPGSGIKQCELGKPVFSVLTVGDQTWRELDLTPIKCCALFIHDSHFIDNLIYILVTTDFVSLRPCLLAFELCSETFRVLEPPKDMSYSHTLAEVNKCIALVEDRMSAVYVLSDYQTEVWEKYTITLRGDHDIITVAGRGISDSPTEIFLKLLKHGEYDECWSYDVESKRWTLSPHLSKAVEDCGTYNLLFFTKHEETLYQGPSVGSYGLSRSRDDYYE